MTSSETVKKGTDREEMIGNLISPAKGRGTELARWRGYFFYQSSIKISLENRRFSRDFFTSRELVLYRTIVRRRKQVHGICTLFCSSHRVSKIIKHSFLTLCEDVL